MRNELTKQKNNDYYYNIKLIVRKTYWKTLIVDRFWPKV